VQVERPSTSNPGGTIIEGVERHTDKMVKVYSLDEKLIGSANLLPGQNVNDVARRIITPV